MKNTKLILFISIILLILGCANVFAKGKKNTIKIDSYSHFSSKEVISFLEKESGKPHPFSKLFLNTPALIDINKKLELMNKYNIQKSILVPLPWIDMTPDIYNNPDLALQASIIQNNITYKAIKEYPDRFYGVALIPTTNSEVMIKEFDRCIKELGFVGAVIPVGQGIKSPVDKDYEALYKRAEELDVPIWIHPARGKNTGDFKGESFSEYQIWQAYGWLLDSTSAMTHIVFSGVFERYPNLKLIIHHHGALTPLFIDRLEEGISFFEKASGAKYNSQISKPYKEHFKKFYCDTATQGISPLLIKNAVDFFGEDKVLFGTDAPMDSKNGEIFIIDSIESINQNKFSPKILSKIYYTNVKNLINKN